MLDDPATVTALMQEMEAQLPIPAFPTKPLARLMQQKGERVSADHELTIRKVFYAGDEGGITCDVTPGASSLAYVVSLTQLQIPITHPLSHAVRAYQRERVKRIAEANASAPNR